MSTLPHPWRNLRDRDDVVVSWRDDLPIGMHAATNGVDRIWLRKGLLQVERRCALAHELVHVDQGHTCGQSEKIELQVEKITARWLIDFDELIDSAKWARTIHEWADELWVTRDVLFTRLKHLDPAELAIAKTAIAAAFENGAN